MSWISAFAKVVLPDPDGPITEAVVAVLERRITPAQALARSQTPREREAAEADRYAVYLDERPGQLNSTAFFMDAAEVFFEKGQTALAVRVLSNLAEMELENRHILRILAYRLSQAGLHALALPLVVVQVQLLQPTNVTVMVQSLVEHSVVLVVIP